MNIAQWRKDRLAVPSLAVLNRAAELMAANPEPKHVFVHAAIKWAIMEDASATVQDFNTFSSGQVQSARAAQDGALADVVLTYTRAVRDYALTTVRGGQDFAWWMAGKNASVIAKRRKAIVRFVEAAIEAGAELEKAEETLTYRAAIGAFTAIIEKFKVESETKSTVSYYPPEGPMVSERKDAPNHAHFATWEEAHLFLKAYSAQKLADARRALELAQSYDGNVRGMKERSRKKVTIVQSMTPAEAAKEVVEVTQADIAAPQADPMTDAELAAAVPA